MEEKLNQVIEHIKETMDEIAPNERLWAFSLIIRGIVRDFFPAQVVDTLPDLPAVPLDIPPNIPLNPKKTEGTAKCPHCDADIKITLS